MFTGIVTDVGEILQVRARGEGLRQLKISCHYERGTIVNGASIACSGICLTVIASGEENGHTWFAVEAAAETLNVTTAGRWQKGTRVNLERPLKMGDELGGHVVAGHVDGLGRVVSREDRAESARIALEAPKPLMRFIAPKGSITIDGVSLTVNAAESDTFSVLIIPHTLKVTTLGGLRAGDEVNLEIDLMARYAARLSETQ